MTALLDVMAVRATGDPAAAVVECGEPGRDIAEIACDVLVAGGGTGGIAAALAAARGGRTVCLIEETDWSLYGRGKNPKCSNCMAHCGYEPTAVLKTTGSVKESIRAALAH